MAALAASTRNCWTPWARRRPHDPVSARFQVLARLVQGAAGAGPHAGDAARGRTALPPAARLAETSHRAGPVAGRWRAGRGVGHRRLFAGRLLRDVSGRTSWL